jgi:hypothetical protein
MTSTAIFLAGGLCGILFAVVMIAVAAFILAAKVHDVTRQMDPAGRAGD